MAQLCSAFPTRLYKIDPTKIDTTKSTVDLTVDNNAMGTCTCDITAGSCDAYCCCDTDCNVDLLSTWNANYDSYCVKNYIGVAFKPDSKCIDSDYIYNYNTRMGMIVTKTDDELCVELDTSTAGTSKDYIPYMKVFNDQPTNLKYDIRTL